MERLTARDFAPELLELYDFYVHGKLNRRESSTAPPPSPCAA